MLEELTTEETGIDMNEAISAEDLGLGEQPDPVETDPPDTAIDDAAAPVVADKATDAPTTRPVPKSWAKETEELWLKIPPEAQAQIEKREKQMLDGLDQYKEYAGVGKQLHEVITPYQTMLQAHGIDAPKAVAYLLKAHERLSTGTMESRKAAYEELGNNIGLTGATQTPVDPTVKALQDQVSNLTNTFTARQQAELNEAKGRVAKEVEAFASDPAHPYFEEVADDIIVMLQSGAKLEDAYEKAVWANPVTRAKELARVTNDNDKKLRENARLDALKAKKASGSNVRSRDTNRAPTEPLGKMEDTMKETLREINSRTH